MSETKVSDADSNIIQSLDELSVSEQNKLELRHIYNEPKKLCDVQINYGNTAFHLHSAILAHNSVYFKNLFEEKDMNKSAIELPHMKDFCDVDIDAEDVKCFFDTIYMCDKNPS